MDARAVPWMRSTDGFEGVQGVPMKLRVFAIVAVLAAAFGVSAISSANNGDKATGGGQVLFSTDPGAGNTIAFTAQDTGGPQDKGQVQFIDRSGGNGQDQVKFHGVVECIEVDGNTARISGREKSSGDPFQLATMDNGEPNMGNDMIEMNTMAQEVTCDPNEFEDGSPDFSLARGNVQVTDGS
jgi:hypothetical protein